MGAPTHCTECRLPLATKADVDAAHSSAFMDGRGICWHGDGSAYAEDGCRTPMSHAPTSEAEAIQQALEAGAEIEKLLDLAVEKRAALGGASDLDMFQELLRQARLYIPNALDFQKCADCRRWMSLGDCEWCDQCAPDHVDDAPRIQ